MSSLVIQTHLRYLAAVAFLAAAPQRLRAALEDPERGDGGPVPAAVIIAAVLAAALGLAVVIGTAVRNHAKNIH